MARRDDTAGCIGCLGLLVILLILGGIVNLFSGEDEEASTSAVEETTEQSAREETREKTRERSTHPARKSEKEARPEPRTPEERIRAALDGKYAISVEREIKDIWVYPDPANGCTRVRLDYRASSPASIEYQMGQIYRAVYTDEQIGRQACDVEVNAYGETSDDFGQKREELYYSTHLTGSQAARVNWEENARVNFPNIWTLTYKHPTVEQAEAKEELERAVDCAVDEGLFDNWLCPS